MAEITNTASKSKHKLSYTARVDLTPMVDLAFLLITFFMFTTTLAKPTEIAISTPADALIDNPPKLEASKAMTIIIGKDDTCFYYFGLPEAIESSPELVIQSNFSTEKNITTIIKLKKSSVDIEHKLDKLGHTKLYLFIKPTETSQYKNMVKILDEIHIQNIQNYAIREP
jgi:biopolymer transport protein ExbD